MTILVFNSGILTITTPSWCATEITDSNKRFVQVHVPGVMSVRATDLPMSMEDFLQMLTEGGKTVDLRSIQVPEKRHSSK